MLLSVLVHPARPVEMVLTVQMEPQGIILRYTAHRVALYT